MYKINLTLTEEDYINYNEHFFNESGGIKKVRMMTSIFIVFVAFMITWITRVEYNTSFVLGALCTIIPLIYFLPILFYNSFKQKAINILKKDTSGNLLSLRAIEINDIGISSKTENAFTQYKWTLMSI